MSYPRLTDLGLIVGFFYMIYDNNISEGVGGKFLVILGLLNLEHLLIFKELLVS